ncbi:crotonase/enoyl-CoA hydratase family protein [Sulfuriferula multivorans]|nr:crotonase/enoyl-CoA hydratase family protein [Sulfuriferula multivorans]
MNAVVEFQQYSNDNFEQIRTRFDEEYGVMWSFMRPEPRPCFTRTVLQDLLMYQYNLESFKGRVVTNGQIKQANYMVLASDLPGVFNLGGDLATFRRAITQQDREGLLSYAKLCIDNVWTYYNMRAPITTISLVQGQAMGGGFESALSAHVMIAEKSALMGLPEVLFNLFPGMGAFSFLSRKIGMQAADTMVRSGKVYTATELYGMGVVDVLAEDGQGEKALYDWIRKNHRSLNSFQAIQRAKQRVNPLTVEELYEITEIWVDAALRLSERDLKIMERLVRAQNRKVTEPAIAEQAIA